MPQTVTFVTHDKKDGVSASGKPWVLNIFATANDEFSCSTLKPELAQKVLPFVEKQEPVSITTEERINKNGYKSFTLVSVEPANGNAASVGAGVAPAGHEGGKGEPTNQKPSWPATDPKQAIITRSFGVNASADAFKLAIEGFKAGIFEPPITWDAWVDAASKVQHAIVALAFVPASYAFAGPAKNTSGVPRAANAAESSPPPKAGDSSESPAPSAEPTI